MSAKHSNAREVVYVDSVNHLRRINGQVNDAEILGKTMPHENDTQRFKEAQFAVGSLGIKVGEV